MNGLNLGYVGDILRDRPSSYPTRKPLDLYVPKVNQITFGYKSYTYEAPKIWNSLPLEIRKAKNFNMFKKLINNWNGPSHVDVNIMKMGSRGKGVDHSQSNCMSISSHAVNVVNNIVHVYKV